MPGGDVGENDAGIARARIARDIYAEHLGPVSCWTHGASGVTLRAPPQDHPSTRDVVALLGQLADSAGLAPSRGGSARDAYSGAGWSAVRSCACARLRVCVFGGGGGGGGDYCKCVSVPLFVCFVALTVVQPTYGSCVDGERLVPVKLLDVAGLVPGGVPLRGRGIVVVIAACRCALCRRL